jgi:hypothetical protein
VWGADATVMALALHCNTHPPTQARVFQPATFAWRVLLVLLVLLVHLLLLLLLLLLQLLLLLLAAAAAATAPPPPLVARPSLTFEIVALPPSLTPLTLTHSLVCVKLNQEKGLFTRPIAYKLGSVSLFVLCSPSPILSSPLKVSS